MFLIVIQWQLSLLKHLDNKKRKGWRKRVHFVCIGTSGRLFEHHCGSPVSLRLRDYITDY